MACFNKDMVVHQNSYVKTGFVGCGAILIVFFILKTIYIGPSGLPQVGDIFLLISTLYLFCRSDWHLDLDTSSLRMVGVIAALLLYQIAINAIWSIIIGTNLVRYCFYYIYNFIAFLDTIMICRRIGIRQLKLSLFYGAALSLLSPIIGIIISGGNARNVGFFNNPNQLGYHALVVMTVILLFREDYVGWEKYAVMILALFVSVLSASRAAVTGVIVSIGTTVLFDNSTASSIRPARKFCALLAFICLLYFVFFSEGRLASENQQIKLIRVRYENIIKGTEDLEGNRGYGRIKEVELGAFFGVGEGAYDRFSARTGYEIHNTYLSLMVCYGLIGFLGYVVFFVCCIMKRGLTIHYLSAISGVLVFQLVHNGIRNTLIWVTLAVVYCSNNQMLNRTSCSGIQGAQL